MTTINTHSLSIGETELTEPIPDYMLKEILDGRRSVPQELGKALARQVKEMRQELSITVSAHGEVKRGYSRHQALQSVLEWFDTWQIEIGPAEEALLAEVRAALAGEVQKGYSKAADELALGMHKERDRF